MTNQRIAAVAVVFLFAFSGIASAELRHVEIKTLGMD